MQKLESRQAISGTNSLNQVDAEAQLQDAVQTVTTQIVGVICIAVVVGVILGFCCTRMIGKVFARSQKKRLEKARARSDLQFVE